MSVELPGQEIGEARWKTGLAISRLRKAHDLAHDKSVSYSVIRSRKIDAIDDSLELQSKGLLDPRVHITLSFPPQEEDGDLHSDEYMVYVLFPGIAGKPNFISLTRGLLSGHSTLQRIDNFALHVEDIRPETFWERQKRLVAELMQMDKPEVSKDKDWENRKYKKVLAYLGLSMEINKQYPHLEVLFDRDIEENTVRLIMGQPSETNLPDRLRDKNVSPTFTDAENDYETLLDFRDLKEKRDRYRQKSQNPDDAVGAEICRILQIPEAA